MAASVSNYYEDNNGVTFLAWVYTARRDIAGCTVPNNYKGIVTIPKKVDGHDIDWLNGYPDREKDSFSITANRPIDLILPSDCSIGTPYWINRGLFEGCKKLASITIPAGFYLDNDNMNNGMPYAQTINNNMFKDCTSLTNVVATEMTCWFLTTNMFYGCNKLLTASFSANIKDVGKNAFKGCDSLQSVTFAGNVPVGIKDAGIRSEAWVNISTNYLNKWKPSKLHLIATKSALDPFSAIKLRKTLQDKLGNRILHTNRIPSF